MSSAINRKKHSSRLRMLNRNTRYHSGGRVELERQPTNLQRVLRDIFSLFSRRSSRGA
jgi:hypothetical protein